MKYGHLIAAIGALGLVGTGNVSAQSAQTTTSTPASVSASSGTEKAPASPVTFSPSISAGARTFSSGGINSGGNGTTFGPYITPSMKIGFSNSAVKMTLGYELEITGGKGFANSRNQQISDNAYYKHNPTFTVSGGVAPNWKLNALLDAQFYLYNSDQNENNSDISLIPEVEYSLTPNVSVAVGYWLQRQTGFDSILGREKAKNDSSFLSTNVDDKVSRKELAAQLSEVEQSTAEPVVNLHAAVVTAKVKLSEDNKLTTYVRAGKRVGNKADKNSYAYRLQTHLDFATPIAALTGALRYRLNVEDLKNSSIVYYNQGRVVLSYKISDSWSADLFNEFTATQNTAANSKATFENENYVGATFSF